MSSKKNIINSERKALIVDNLSPFTGDIIECLEKLGANYVRRSVFSLAEVSANRNGNNDHHNRSGYKAKIDNLDYEIIEKDKSESDFDTGGKHCDYDDDNNNINNNGISAFNYDKVILSGRRLYSRDINVINSRIIKRCLKDNIPVLGICYGAEILALALGGTLRRMDNPVQKAITITVLRPNPLISPTNTTTLNTMHVFESHRYCVAKLPHDFEVVASSDHCKYEIFSYRDKNLFGTQFHPEKSGKDGLNLLSNFLKL